MKQHHTPKLLICQITHVAFQTSVGITWYLLIVTEDKISHILVIFIHYGGWFLSSIPCRKKWFRNLLGKNMHIHVQMCTCTRTHTHTHTHTHTPKKYHTCSVAKLCSILCDPRNYSPPDSSVHGISQARLLEWLPWPSPGDLPDPGIEPWSPALTWILDHWVTNGEAHFGWY